MTCKLPWRVIFLGVFFLLSLPRAVLSSETWDLLKIVDRTLLQSDAAKDLKETILLSQMDVETAAHQFETKIIPLTSIGFTEGTGSQQLGLELRRETSLGTSINYGLVGNRIDESSGYSVENPMNARAYVKVSQGLFRRWGQKYNLTDLSAAEFRVKQEQIRAERARQNLILTSVSRYYELLLAIKLLENGRQAHERSAENLLAASARQEVGLASKVDVYRAELANLEAESGLEQRRRAEKRAEDNLRELLLLPMEESLQIALQVEKMVPVIPEDWRLTIFETRPDWQAQWLEMRVGDLRISQAEQDLEPDLGLSVTLERKGEGQDSEDALELDQTNWSVQLLLNSSLDSFSEQKSLTKRKIEMAKMKRAREALRRKILREAEDAFLDLLGEEKSHILGLKRLKQAGMALELAKDRYEKGLSNNLDVIDAESAYVEAHSNIARALTGYNLAAVTLAHSLGVLDRQWLSLSLAESGTPGEEEQ